jgi:Xaa-Pro aminopeptidase
VIIGSGPRALLFRYAAGMRRMDPVDQLSLEWAGTYRHYHAAMMRTLCVGEASHYQRHLFCVVREALEEMTGALSPGRPVGEVDDAHRRVLDAAGLKEHRYGACGYSLGATFSPNWMDWPMLFSGNPVQAESGMIFFLHCIVVNSGLGVAMTAGHTCIVTETGREVLSGRPLELVVV